MTHLKTSAYLLWSAAFLLFVSAAIPGCQAVLKAKEPVKLSAEERLWLDSNPDKLTLFFNTDFAPIEFASTEGKFTGLGADIIRQIEKRLAIEFIKTPTDDWEQHLADLKSGACAVAPTIVRTLERESYAFFTLAYAESPVVIITTTAFQGELTLADLVGKRVAVVSGYASENYVRNRSQGRFEVIPLWNVQEALRAVAFGEVDALVENLAVAAWFTDKEGLSNLRVAGRTELSFEWSIGVSRAYPLLFSAVSKALSAISEEKMDAMRKRWISIELYTGLRPETVRQLKAAALFIALLVLCLAVISFLLKHRLNEKVLSLELARHKLMDQSERLNLAMEATHAGIWDFYPKTGKAVFSDQWHLMLGHEPGSVSSSYSGWETLAHPSDTGTVRRQLENYLKSNGPGSLELKFRMRTAGGDWRWILCKGRAVERDETGYPTHITGMNIDIQQLIEIQEELRESEARLRTLSDNLPDGMVYQIETDPEGTERRFTYLSKGVEHLHGITAEEAMKDPLKLYGGILPEDRSLLAKLEADFFSTLSTFRAEVRNIALGDTRWRLLISEPRKLPNGNVVWDGLEIDITQLKQAEEERKKLQTQLLHAQKMESVGTLAGGVAHDFNNLLHIINGFAQLLLNRKTPSDEDHSPLMQIQKSVQRASHLVQQLLTFSRKMDSNRQPLNLNHEILETRRLLQQTLPKMVQIDLMAAEDLWLIEADPVQIEQLILNLATNAADAMPEGGRLLIQTQNVIPGDAFCREHLIKNSDRYVQLTVTDTGCGMDRDTVEKIFDPFFTTKEVGKGTGLGLASVYGIVKNHGGHISCQSTPGRGTGFTILLPAIIGTETRKEEPVTDTADAGGTETILVVDDEQSIRDLAKESLELFGYTVICADTGQQALEIYATRKSEIDIIVLDLNMPGMSGYKCLEALTALDTAVKVLIATGYSVSGDAMNFFSAKAKGFIPKPYQITDLVLKIRQTLDNCP